MVRQERTGVVVTRRPGKPHPMQGQAGPFAGCPPRSRSAAQMDDCPRQDPAYRPATGTAPPRRGRPISRDPSALRRTAGVDGAGAEAQAVRVLLDRVRDEAGDAGKQFDSRGGWEYQQKNASGNLIGRKNWVDSKVVDWFQKTSSSLSKLHNKTIPSLAFVHEPVHASKAFQSQQKGVDPNRQPGINDDVPLAAQADGWCPDGSNGDACEYGGQDVPFMEALASTPGLMGVFSGHDHGISWCYKWNSTIKGMAVAGNGVNLCFGQHTGYGGYGTWARGSRQVLLTEAMLETFEAETWIRLEKGEVVGRVALNSTYGEDRYPETVNWHSSGPEEGYTLDG